MSMSAGSSGEDAVPVINITPLIDILLVLLIIFMIISPLKPTRFEAKVPSEPKDEAVKPQPNPLTLSVEINKDGTVRVNKEDGGTVEDPGALGARLTQVFKEREANGVFRENTNPPEIEKTVFIKAPRTLSYGSVVKVVDAVKGAGASPVGLQIDDLSN